MNSTVDPDHDAIDDGTKRLATTQGVKNQTSTNRAAWDRLVYWHQKQQKQWSKKQQHGVQYQAQLERLWAERFAVPYAPSGVLDWESLNEFNQQVHQSVLKNRKNPRLNHYNKVEDPLQMQLIRILGSIPEPSVKEFLRKSTFAQMLVQRFVGQPEGKSMQQLSYQALGMSAQKVQQLQSADVLCNWYRYAQQCLPPEDYQEPGALVPTQLAVNAPLRASLLHLALETVHDKGTVPWLGVPMYWVISALDEHGNAQWYQLDEQGIEPMQVQTVQNVWLEGLKEIKVNPFFIPGNPAEHIGSFIQTVLPQYLDHIDGLCRLIQIKGAPQVLLQYDPQQPQEHKRLVQQKRYEGTNVCTPLHALMCADMALEQIQITAQRFEQCVQLLEVQNQCALAPNVLRQWNGLAKALQQRVQESQNKIHKAAGNYIRDLASLGRTEQKNATVKFYYGSQVHVSSSSILWQCLVHPSLRQLSTAKQTHWITKLTQGLCFTEQEMQCLKTSQLGTEPIGHINQALKQTYVTADQWSKISTLVPLIHSIIEGRTLEGALCVPLKGSTDEKGAQTATTNTVPAQRRL